MNLSPIERRLVKLEGKEAMQRHIIIVQFEGDDDPGPITMLSHRGEVFSRTANEPHDVFVNRAAGDAEGVIVMFAIEAKRPAKHPLANSFYLSSNA